MPNRDLILTDDIGSLALDLYADPKTVKGIRTSFDPPSVGPQDHLWRDGKNGYGYSQPVGVDDGYAYSTIGTASTTLDTLATYGAGVDARQPGVIVPAGAITELDLSGVSSTSSITGSFVLGEDVYFLAGNALIKILSGYSTISAPTNAGVGATFTCAAVAKYSGTIYAWLGVSNGFAKWDGTTLTKTTSFVRQQIVTVYWATTDGVQVQRLYSNDTNFTTTDVALTADPMTGGNWTAAAQVGEGVYSINKLVTAGHHVWAITSGGVYDQDDLRQSYNLTPYHRDADSFYNGQQAYFVDNTILYSGLTGIDAVDVTNPLVKQSFPNWILPGQNGIPNNTPIWGRPTAYAFDDGWVVAALFNSTDSYIVYGKRRARLGYPGPTEWVWHGALARFSQQIVTCLQVKTVIQSGNASKRLFIATVDRAITPIVRLFWQSLPLTTNARQDYLEGSPHRFSTTCSLYLPPGNWQASGHNKTAILATFDTRQLDSSRTMDLYLATDETTFGSTLGTIATSPTKTLPLTATGTGTAQRIIGSQITPLIKMTGTSTVPPALFSLTIQAAIDPQADEVLDFDVLFTREPETNNGAHLKHARPERDYQILCAMQGKVVTLQTPDQNTVQFLIETATPGVWSQVPSGGAAPKDDGARSWQRKVTVRGRIVNKPSRYGEDLYGQDSAYN